jgi:hypothetical protein
MTSASEGYYPSTEVFSKPLFRSFFFLLGSFTFLVAVTFDVTILADHWSQLGRHVVFWLILVMVGLVVFWVRSILLHREIRELYQSGAILDGPENSPIHAVIGVAENMFFLSFYSTFFLSGALLAQILAILPQN